MVITLITLLFSLIGLGLLICIHELGHLLAARSVGMKIECFGIGFGKPLFKGIIKGVPVHVGWIPFGGYVKIAGMEEPGEKLPKGHHKPAHHHAKEDPNGFFAKSPFARIWVASAGPLANVLFCFVAFTAVWLGGGRTKPYSFMTDRIGLLDVKSPLYAQGVRPGDRITAYGPLTVGLSRDHLRAALMVQDGADLQVESLSGTQKTLHASPYTVSQDEKGMKTFGVSTPASFLVWNPPRTGMSSLNPNTAFKAGDRILWVNGEGIFSMGQLREVLLRDEAYLTVFRKGKIVHVSVPRCHVSDLKLSKEIRGEMMDWMYEAGLSKDKLSSLSFIPYNLTHDCVVEGPVPFASEKGNLEPRLYAGDTILSISGVPVTKSSDLLREVQQPKAVIIVERGVSYKKIASLSELDRIFTRPFTSPELQAMVQSIGTLESPKSEHLQVLANFPLVSADGTTDSQALYLGLLGVQDVSTRYNPSPVEAVSALFEEITSTLGALFSGSVSPKWMCGPVGIVQLVQQQWAYGGFDVLFWLGAISFNLALINLLPLPVLDGGYILMAFFEIITFRRINPKISVRIITPFAFLLFGLLIYLTYNDVVRIIQQLYR